MVWWHGPPWCVLRNRNVYLWRVMDYATTESLLYTVQDLPAGDWRIALQAAQPGRLSAGAWTFLVPDTGPAPAWRRLRLPQPRPPAGRQAPLAAVATGDAGLRRPVFRAASALAPCFLARQDAAAARARKTRSIMMRFGNRTARTLQCSFSSLKTGVVRAVAPSTHGSRYPAAGGNCSGAPWPCLCAVPGSRISYINAGAGTTPSVSTL